MILLETDDLSPWIFGILHGEPTTSGGFLLSLAEAARQADAENFELMRPALLLIQKKYPKYRCTCQEWPAAAGAGKE